MEKRIWRIFLFLFYFGATLLGALSRSEASELKITKIPSNGGRIETAHVSYYDGKMYVEGRIQPYFWNGGRITFKVDVKDAAGTIIASKTDYSLLTGRPQIIAQVGVVYVVSFDECQLSNATSVDIHYLN